MEARFTGENAYGCRVEAVGGPSQDPIPEDGHLPKGAGIGGKEICTVCEDGEDQPSCKYSVNVWCKTHFWAGELFNNRKGLLCKGQSFLKVG